MIYNYDTGWLYKRAITGDIRRWRGNIQCVDEDIVIVTRHGSARDGSKLTVIYSEPIKGKNIGRSNETSPFQQAEKELKSKYESQLKNGYKPVSMSILDQRDFVTKYDALNSVIPLYNTDNNNNIIPMKCQKRAPDDREIDTLGQPKINGNRATISWDDNYYEECKAAAGLFGECPDWKHICIRSKKGLVYEIDHIQEAWYEIFNIIGDKIPNFKSLIFDGELYIKDKPVATIGGACRNKSNENHKDLIYVLFDLAIPDLIQDERFDILDTMMEILEDSNIVTGVLEETYHASYMVGDHDNFPCYHVVYLCPHEIDSPDYAIAYMNACIEHGYEGAIIRNRKAVYGFGQRPSYIIKLKKTQSSEFKVINVKLVGDPKQPVGFAAVMTCQNDINDEIFDCSYYGSVRDKEDIYRLFKQGYLNDKLMTISFYERTKNGVPLHITETTLRDYE